MATILVDQSYKIEQTNHDTIIAATRGQDAAAVQIDRRLKRTLLQEFGQRVGGRRIYLWLFAFGACIAIAKLWRKGDIIRIDLEYEGSSSLVEDLVAAYLLKEGIIVNRTSIASARVGKHSFADSVSRIPPLAKHFLRLDVSMAKQVTAALGL